ncbi:MAG: hypothetical protein GY711_28195 [bacterium]|nr:hypothetical protein [bacterium]
MACSCSHEGTTTVPTPGTCTTRCEGCTFSQSIRCATESGRCVFRGTVSRTGCANQPDKNWDVDITMECGTADRVVDYYCDTAGECIGYKVTYSCSNDSTSPNE